MTLAGDAVVTALRSTGMADVYLPASISACPCASSVSAVGGGVVAAAGVPLA